MSLVMIPFLPVQSRRFFNGISSDFRNMCTGNRYLKSISARRFPERICSFLSWKMGTIPTRWGSSNDKAHPEKRDPVSRCKQAVWPGVWPGVGIAFIPYLRSSFAYPALSRGISRPLEEEGRLTGLILDQTPPLLMIPRSFFRFPGFRYQRGQARSLFPE